MQYVSQQGQVNSMVKVSSLSKLSYVANYVAIACSYLDSFIYRNNVFLVHLTVFKKLCT